MNNMRKLLNISYPYIKCYPHHANIWATIGDSDYKSCVLSSNYLQLVYDRLWNRMDFNNGLDIIEYVKNYPLVKMKCYDAKIIDEQWEYYSKFVVDCIDKGYYVYLIIDRYYITAYLNNHGNHSVHDIMIYGYDMEHKLFMAADYFDSQYEFKNISFEELEQARANLGDNDWLDGVYAWKKKEKIFQGINFQINEIKNLLWKFIKEKKTISLTQYSAQIRDDKNRFIYGLGIYDELIDNVERNRIIKNNLDIRPPYIMYEHKVYFKKICSELNHFTLLKNYTNHKKEIEVMQQKWRIILNLYIKFNLAKNEKEIDKIKTLISEAKERDKKVFQEILNDITEQTYNYEEKVLLTEKCIRSRYMSWKNILGKDGYDIVGDVRKYPDYLLKDSYQVIQGKIVFLLQSDADQRGLEGVSESSDWQIGYIVDPSQIILRMKFEKDNYPIVTCYFVDYDRLSRKIEMTVVDASCNVVFAKEIIEDFENGIYISFCAKEEIFMKIKKLQGPDAVLSAVFWN